MRGPEVRPIVIAAGGTGGHFYPAEALASALIGRGHWVVLMTDARAVVPRGSVFDARNQYVLPAAGIAGRGAARASKAVFALAAGVARARSILARIRPAAVVAFGGYPAVPPVLASRLVRGRPPVILHEQNAVLGRANRFLARHASVLALSFADTARVPPKVRRLVTGNPVRPAVAALCEADYEPPLGPKHDGSILGGSIRVLVLGGSLGARVFSEVVPAAIERLPDAIRARLMITQQCRAEDLDQVRATYAAQRISAELATFFPDVADRLRAAHLVIARAGASTVAELAIAGRPSILVPLPGAIDNHQSANAKALADAGGAWVMPQPGFTVDSLAERLGELLSDSATLALGAMHARRVARPGAADALADLVEQVMRDTAPATEPASGGPLRGQSVRPATRTDEQPRMGQS
ncbi:MAG TPA: undecaprenyldiphospho-muramoylpentapeptide beta-N-acetylglucosaminyltransferase [Acetobacteraceae bacterium]|nr:undecaprenyldiphospho-muramoylpentapeptide beta-N-acetylglucosaminyltransferase [Acetobacteraceae bacterium]